MLMLSDDSARAARKFQYRMMLSKGANASIVDIARATRHGMK